MTLGSFINVGSSFAGTIKRVSVLSLQSMSKKTLLLVIIDL